MKFYELLFQMKPKFEILRKNQFINDILQYVIQILNSNYF